MMVNNMTTITLSGQTYPIRFDLAVLEYVQEKYGSIIAFENALLSRKQLTDSKGKPILDKDGNTKVFYGEPSCKVIMDILPVMINEGLEAEKMLYGGQREREDAEKLRKIIDIGFMKLAGIIHAEFLKNFNLEDDEKNAKTT